jgi:hypothetical protein
MEKGLKSINGYTPLQVGPLMLAALLAGAGSTIANLLLASFASAIFPVPESFRPFTLFPILAACIGSSLGAAGLFSFIERISTLPTRSFKRAALVLLLLSFIFPASLVRQASPGLPAIGWEIAGTLMLMHSITALICVRAVNRLSSTG